MSTDFRALCAELHVAVQLYTGQNPAAAETPANELVARLMAALAATTTALAQSEPEGVGDEELLRTYGKAKRDHCYEGPMDDWPKRAERAATVHGLRAVLTRYARPTTEPVPVAERPWEREGWCDAEGMCWLHRPAEIPCRLANGTLYRWVLDTPCRDEEEPVHDTHSLPHHALPVPGAEAGQP